VFPYCIRILSFMSSPEKFQHLYFFPSIQTHRFAELQTNESIILSFISPSKKSQNLDYFSIYSDSRTRKLADSWKNNSSFHNSVRKLSTLRLFFPSIQTHKIVNLWTHESIILPFISPSKNSQHLYYFSIYSDSWTCGLRKS